MSISTTDRDLGYKKIIAEYHKAKGSYVKIGFVGAEALEAKQAGKTKDGITPVSPGLTVVQVATWHEFGGENNRPPERSFLRSTFDRTIRERNEFVKNLLSKILQRTMDIPRALSLMGLKGVKDVKTTIQKSIGIKPLSDVTIAAKGSSKPLIDTGQMINSITYERVLGGDKRGGV